MFTREALRRRLPDLVTAAVPLDVVRLGPQDFDPPDGEESIEIYRAPTTRIRDPLLLWVSLAALRWPRAPGGLGAFLADASLCQPLSEAELNQAVAQRAAGLVRPLAQPLHPPRGFGGALRMIDEWYEVVVIAAYEDERIGFGWSTTA